MKPEYREMRLKQLSRSLCLFWRSPRSWKPVQEAWLAPRCSRGVRHVETIDDVGLCCENDAAVDPRIMRNLNPEDRNFIRPLFAALLMAMDGELSYM